MHNKLRLVQLDRPSDTNVSVEVFPRLSLPDVFDGGNVRTLHTSTVEKPYSRTCLRMASLRILQARSSLVACRTWVGKYEWLLQRKPYVDCRPEFVSVVSPLALAMQYLLLRVHKQYWLCSRCRGMTGARHWYIYQSHCFILSVASDNPKEKLHRCFLLESHSIWTALA